MLELHHLSMTDPALPWLPRRRAVLALSLMLALPASARPSAGAPRLSADAAYLLTWVLARGDNRGRAFAIVDKKQGEIFVFGVKGQLAGTSPALVGKATGDTDEPGIGHLEVSQLTAEQRKTPAGRYPSRRVESHHAHHIWFDYDAGLAIHQLVDDSTYVPRMSRLNSGNLAERRITAGCVAVPVDFFAKVVRPVLGAHAGVVYVLPDTLALKDLFPPS